MPPYYLPREKPAHRTPLKWYPSSVPIPDVAYLMLPQEMSGSRIRDWRSNLAITALGTGNAWSSGDIQMGGSSGIVPSEFTSGTSHSWVFWARGSNTAPLAGGSYFYDQQTTRLIFAYSDGAGVPYNRIAYYDGTWRLSTYATPTDAKYHMYGYVMDAGATQGRIYVDGNLVGSLTYTPVAVAASSRYLFARYANDTGYLPGSWRGMWFWANRLLTSAEIATHYADPYMWLREPRRVWMPSAAVTGNPYYAYAQQ